MKEADVRTVDHAQPGWRIANDCVELFVTEKGGHMAPVHFDIGRGRDLQPYYISPWQEEGIGELPEPVLIPLRGDFFCMPFGSSREEPEGDRHPVHGEVASSPWQFAGLTQDGDWTTLTLEMRTRIRPGRVTKTLRLHRGHNVVYSSHLLEGYAGKMPLGHHPTLDVPEEEGSLRVAVGDFEFGLTPSTLFSDPARREYQSLAPGREFTDLTQVEVIWKDAPPADCTSFPARTGFTDLLQLLRRPTAQPAWTVALCPARGYLWFSLKDAAVLPSTLFWIANRGRHASPWNGRNRCLGLEETCTCFGDGITACSRPNRISDAGFPTAIDLSPDHPTDIRLIQGAVRISPAFQQVQSVTFAEDRVMFTSTTGETVSTDVCWRFVMSGSMP